MSLDLRVTYGIQVLSGQPGYPYGKARNVTVSGDGTGTPFEASLVNDWIGFQQALLSNAGITPSGVPDKVGASDYFEAVKYLTRNISGTVNVSGGSVVVIGPGGAVGADYVLSSGAILGPIDNSFTTPSTFSKPATFQDVSTFDKQITVNLGGIVVGGGFVAIGNGLNGILVQQGGLTVLNGTVDITPPAFFEDEIILGTLGRIRERVIYAPDADHTFDPTDGTVIVAQSGTVLAGRTWKLNDAAAEGATLRLVNYTGFTMTLHNSSGGVLLAAPNVGPFAGATPGTVRLIWLNNGAYTGWSAY